MQIYLRNILSAAFALVVLTLISGCRKEAGEGGVASIRGKVRKEVRLVLSNPATAQYTVNAADQDVYIIYGDNVSPDDRIWTNYKGEFEFMNLREGKYTVYVYSRDTTGVPTVDPERMVVKKEIEIGKKENDEDAGTFLIFDVP
ncbi:MAG: hypothetical protein ACK500_09050 [Flavobacteriales bacterium]|jgi:hypothetical protein